MASAYSIFFYFFHHKMLGFDFELHSEGLRHLLNGVDTSTLQTCSPEEEKKKALGAGLALTARPQCPAGQKQLLRTSHKAILGV